MNDFLKGVEADSGHVIERILGRRARLIDPDGLSQEYSALEPDQYLLCAFFGEGREVDDESGYDKAVEKPIAIFRKASLNKIPRGGENWMVTVWLSEDRKEVFRSDGAPLPATTIGYIKLRLIKTVQTELEDFRCPKGVLRD